MTEIENRELLEFVDKLPGFSAAVLKIISLANNPKSSPTDLVSAVSMDAMLTAKLLRLVNSAFYKTAAPISSLNRAVIMLGFNTIKNMALSVAVVNALGIKDNFQRFTNEQFWEHSLGCAIASRILGKTIHASPAEVEEFFVAGLLHDIGRAVLISRYGPRCEEIYTGSGPKSISELESNEFSLSHAQLGAIIARHWKLPEPLCVAIESHHDPLGIEDSQEKKRGRKIALVVHVGNIYSHKMEIGIMDWPTDDNISEEVLSELELEPAQIESSLTDLVSGVEDARSFLQSVES